MLNVTEIATGAAAVSMVPALVLFCLASGKLVSKNSEGVAFLIFGILTLIAAGNLQAVLFAASVLAWGAWCTRVMTQKLSHRLSEGLRSYAVAHHWDNLLPH